MVFYSAGLALPVFVDTVTVLVAAARPGIKRTAVTCRGTRNDQTEVRMVVALSHGDMLLFLKSCRIDSQVRSTFFNLTMRVSLRSFCYVSLDRPITRHKSMPCKPQRCDSRCGSMLRNAWRCFWQIELPSSEEALIESCFSAGL